MEHNPVVALLLALGLIIAASRIAGTIARRFGQPRVLGELLIGVILGPTLLDMLHWGVFHGVRLEEIVRELAEVGVVFLMFIVGLEVNVGELLRVGRVAVIAGVLGTLVPVLFAAPVVLAFGFSPQVALFAGVTLAATSVSISAQVLLELGYLQTKEGGALLATALVDDILAILLVSIVVAVVGAGAVEAAGESGGAGAIIAIIVRMVLYLVGALLVAWFALPLLFRRIEDTPAVAQSFGLEAIAIVTMFLFAWSAEEIGGVAMITGAFIAGVGISRASPDIKHRVEGAISAIAYSFLVPIFFVDVGLEIDLSTFPLTALPMALLLLLGGVISKIGGCGIGARLGGFNNTESLRLGVCMISRGEVGLIIASLGVSIGIFGTGDAVFSSLFLVILLTTVLTPIAVRWVFQRTEGSTT